MPNSISSIVEAVVLHPSTLTRCKHIIQATTVDWVDPTGCHLKMAKSAKLTALVLVIRVMIISVLATSMVILIILVRSSRVKTVQGHGVSVTELAAITSPAGTTTESQETLDVILVCSPIVLVSRWAHIELS
jgi:hypothetical protein